MAALDGKSHEEQKFSLLTYTFLKKTHIYIETFCTFPLDSSRAFTAKHLRWQHQFTVLMKLQACCLSSVMQSQYLVGSLLTGAVDHYKNGILAPQDCDVIFFNIKPLLHKGSVGSRHLDPWLMLFEDFFQALPGWKILARFFSSFFSNTSLGILLFSRFFHFAHGLFQAFPTRCLAKCT